MSGFDGERNVQADEVRFGKHPLFGREFGWEINWRCIMIEHSHIEPHATARDGLADPPHAENPQRKDRPR